jgi:hypothetical protein
MATPRAACLLLLILCAAVPLVHSQGLAPNPAARLGSSSSYNRLQAVYGKSRAWIKSYTRSRRSTCSLRKGSLCSSGLSNGEYAQLLMATSPQSYDARRNAGKFSAVGPVENQASTCITCMGSWYMMNNQPAFTPQLNAHARPIRKWIST